MFKGFSLCRSVSYSIFALCIGSSSLVFANYYQNQQTTSQEYEKSHTGYGSQNETSDEALSKKVKDKIGPGWFSKGYEQVNVQVRNGDVLLRGSVKTKEDKEKLEKEVRNIDGVKNVNSQVKVQELPSNRDNKEGSYSKAFAQDRYTSPEDKQLNNRIRDAISRGWFVDSYKEVILNTSNGVVTLEGMVDSVDDQKDLLNDVQKIEGVKLVQSRLKIKNAEKGNE